MCFKFVKFDSKTYIFHYKKGKIVKQGLGLSFYASKRRSSIEAVPIGSKDIPFIFEETTSDYQTITIQGQMTYVIEHPDKLAQNLDFTVDLNGVYKTDDKVKLEQRLINEAKAAVTSLVQTTELTKSLTSGKLIQEAIYIGINKSETLETLGIKILAVNIISLKPKPETAKALETSTRERLQKEADKAIFDRRNFAVEQERKIKESELNTEIAISEKQKQIVQKEMEKEQLKKENSKKLRMMQIEADIEVETEKSKFIKQKIDNDKQLADSNKYMVMAQIEPFKDLDWKVINALKSNSSATENIAEAFNKLAENSQKIENLNISPDLLQTIIDQK